MGTEMDGQSEAAYTLRNRGDLEYATAAIFYFQRDHEHATRSPDIVERLTVADEIAIDSERPVAEGLSLDEVELCKDALRWIMSSHGARFVGSLGSRVRGTELLDSLEQIAQG